MNLKSVATTETLSKTSSLIMNSSFWQTVDFPAAKIKRNGRSMIKLNHQVTVLSLKKVPARLPATRSKLSGFAPKRRVCLCLKV